MTSLSLNNPNWFRGFIALCCLVVLIILATSCSHTKDLQKKSTEVKSDSVAVTTSIETTTGELTIKGDTIIGSGDETTPINIEDGEMKLIVTEDKITHKMAATAIQKPKVVPVNIVKVTDSKIEVKRTEKQQDKTIHKVVTGGINWNWLWVLVLIVMLILAWRFGLFNKKPTS
jgi:hypothetical protein